MRYFEKIRREAEFHAGKYVDIVYMDILAREFERA